jgi:hypothetical protein
MYEQYCMVGTDSAGMGLWGSVNSASVVNVLDYPGMGYL